MQKIKSDRIELTEVLLKKLGNERNRTGVGFQSLLRGNPIRGLSSALMNTWMSGMTTTAKREYVEGVFKLYENLPTVEMVELTEKTRQLLREKIKETGLPLKRLLALRDDVPKGLKARDFQMVLSQSHKYNKLWGNYILAACKAYIEKRLAYEQENSSPSQKGYRTRFEGYQPIPEKDLETIRQRVKVIDGLYKTIFLQNNVPNDLSRVMVQSWVSGRVKNANPNHVRWVLKESEKLLSNARIELTIEMRETLRLHAERTGLGPKRLLDVIGDFPEEISVGMISGWLNGPTMTARKDYYDFVLEQWRRIP